MESEENHFLVVRGKNKMGGITPKLAKKPDFDVVPNQRKQLK